MVSMSLGRDWRYTKPSPLVSHTSLHFGHLPLSCFFLTTFLSTPFKNAQWRCHWKKWWKQQKHNTDNFSPVTFLSVALLCLICLLYQTQVITERPLCLSLGFVWCCTAWSKLSKSFIINTSHWYSEWPFTGGGRANHFRGVKETRICRNSQAGDRGSSLQTCSPEVLPLSHGKQKSPKRNSLRTIHRKV